MSSFTPAEMPYSGEQRLGRLVTVDAAVGPHGGPVGFRYNEELDAIDVGGHDRGKSKKFREAGSSVKAAFGVDDGLPPWKARGMEVCARAEVFSEGGGEIVEGLSGESIRILPQRIVGWSLDSDACKPNSRSAG